MKNKDNLELKKDFQKTIKRLKKMEGKIRGCCLKSMVDFLLSSEDKKFLPDIQNKLSEYGFKEDLRRVKTLTWYPVSYIIASLFSFYEILEWGDEEIRQAGRNCPKSSAQIVFRISTSIYVLSLEKAFAMLPSAWRKLVNFGNLKGFELNEKEKYLTARIRDFPVHPLYCKFIEGFGEGLGKVLIRSEKISCRERKCVFQGDSYHEFVVRWQTE
ncbi:MAG: hypothetical protein GF370_00100 [Candidatus Nealsonbacteria bacterium]|nr:hypothetical protein [Candidatus Nealsonbacteria bacterium]